MCAYYIIYYISFFVYNEGPSKTHQSSLTLKGGSTSHFGLLPSGKKRKPLLLNSLYDPFGSPCRGQKRRSEPFHSMVGGPAEVYASSGAAVFCAGMNPLSLKDLLKGCLLVAFFENLPVLLLLIKRAALGNLKANFHCAHLHNLSPQGTRDVPTALSIVFTTPSVPLVGDRNGAQTATL